MITAADKHRRDTTGRKDVVLGLVSGYSYHQLHPFFASLAETGFAGRTVIFHDRLSSGCLEEIARWKVELIPFRAVSFKLAGRELRTDGKLQYPAALAHILLRAAGKSSARLRLGLWPAWAALAFHPANSRFVLGWQWLRKEEPSIRNVLLTDVRDVVFQADPFSRFRSDGVVMALEPPGVTLKTDQNYNAWFTEVCGSRFVQEAAQRRISCCGVVMGRAPAMAAYLERMTELMFRSSRCFHFGLDSVVHNRIAWENLVPDVVVGENGAGGIIHLGGIAGAALRQNEQGVVCDEEGLPVPIVHQYDRHPQLAATWMARGKETDR